MNRRTFIRTVFGGAMVAISSPCLAFGTSKWDIMSAVSSDHLADLLMWAPFEAFLPDETDPVIDDPNDGTGTGTLTADQIEKGSTITFQYWHGHNGVYHMFTVTADNLATLRSGNPVVIDVPTTVVEDHYHFAIIDPNRPA